jgi:DNA repair protein RecO (recombination protein O)
MNIRETEAIVLRTFKLAEADKIVVCFTKKYGLIRGVAKGARRLKSRFGAGLEPFTLISLSFHEKEGVELLTIRQVEIVHSFFNLANRTEMVAGLEYLSELAIEFVPPHQADEKFYRMMKACLMAVNKAPEHWHALGRYFEIWSLKLSGFLAELDKCSSCGRDLAISGEGRVHATPEFLLRCEACAKGGEMKLKFDVFNLIRAARREPPESWAKQFVNANSSTQENILRLTRALIERHLERRPRGITMPAGNIYNIAS